MRGLGAKDGTDSERRRAEVLRQDAEARKPSPLISTYSKDCPKDSLAYFKGDEG